MSKNKAPRIINTSPKPRRIAPKVVADALGAVPYIPKLRVSAVAQPRRDVVLTVGPVTWNNATQADYERAARLAGYSTVPARSFTGWIEGEAAVELTDSLHDALGDPSDRDEYALAAPRGAIHMLRAALPHTWAQIWSNK